MDAWMDGSTARHTAGRPFLPRQGKAPPGQRWAHLAPLVMNEQPFFVVFNFPIAESRGAFQTLQLRCYVEIYCVLMACLRFAGAFCNLPGVISPQGILQLESASSCGVVTLWHCVHTTILCWLHRDAFINISDVRLVFAAIRSSGDDQFLDALCSLGSFKSDGSIIILLEITRGLG